MDVLVVCSAAMMVGFCSLIAYRSLRVFTRDRRSPEFYVGLSFLTTAIGLGSLYASLAVAESEGALRLGSALAALGLTASAACVLRVIALLFRPEGAVVRTLLYAGIFVASLVAGLSLMRAVDGPADLLRSFTGVSLLPNAFLCAVLFWLSVEAGRSWQQLVRRSALGLADPLLVNRMFLYMLGSALSCATILSVTIPAAWFGIDPLQDPRVQVVSGLLGTPIGVIYYLALVPPKAYERWLVGDREPAA